MSPAMQTFQNDKAAYWQMRDELLKMHWHQWVAVSGGGGAASDSAEGVLDLAYQHGGARPLYIIKVGDKAQLSPNRQKSRRFVWRQVVLAKI